MLLYVNELYGTGTVCCQTWTMEYANVVDHYYFTNDEENDINNLIKDVFVVLH